LNLLVQHPWLGIGIDSLRPQLAHHLKHMGSPLQGTYSNLNPHNQWLFLALSAGIPFLLLWLSLWFFPVLFLKNSLNSFFVFFFAMISLAMCTEDVLDTQAGVFQVVFFWILTLQSPESAKN
jgi:O-antigen ligase